MIKINKARSKILILLLVIAGTFVFGMHSTAFAEENFTTIDEISTGADCEYRALHIGEPDYKEGDTTKQYLDLDGKSCAPPDDGKVCGKGGDDNKNEVKVSFDFGCIGKKYSGENLNPIVDIMFAIFRFLSAGVGLIVVGSIIIAGIQYSAARGNPQATQNAIKRISNALIGLLVYIFLFAIANFLVPGGMFL